MIMTFVTGAISKFMGFVQYGLDWIIKFVHLEKYKAEYEWLVSLTGKLNYFLPVKETLLVLSMLCAFAFSMFLFWGIQKLIGLIRG